MSRADCGRVRMWECDDITRRMRERQLKLAIRFIWARPFDVNSGVINTGVSET
jgi:hypothetical protein